MNIYISASELAVLTRHNTYKDISEMYIKYWQKYFKSDYDRIIASVSKTNQKIKLPESASQSVARIAKEHNLKKEDVEKVFKSSNKKTVTSMNKDRESALKSMLKKVPKKEQDLLTKSVNSVAFTNFGTKNETGGVKLFEQLRNVVVETPSNYYSENLFIIEDHNNKPTTWSIGGKIDGIYTNNDGDKIILEIKNRMRGLFNSLRDYEKVQCYAYMHILDLEQVSLAECYKTKEGNEMCIIDITWDDDYWETEIVDKLSNFIDDFYDFLKDDNRKRAIIT